jgi:hypothetical protein
MRVPTRLCPRLCLLGTTMSRRAMRDSSRMARRPHPCRRCRSSTAPRRRRLPIILDRPRLQTVRTPADGRARRRASGACRPSRARRAAIGAQAGGVGMPAACGACRPLLPACPVEARGGTASGSGSEIRRARDRGRTSRVSRCACDDCPCRHDFLFVFWAYVLTCLNFRRYGRHSLGTQRTPSTPVSQAQGQAQASRPTSAPVTRDEHAPRHHPRGGVPIPSPPPPQVPLVAFWRWQWQGRDQPHSQSQLAFAQRGGFRGGA